MNYFDFDQDIMGKFAQSTEDILRDLDPENREAERAWYETRSRKSRKSENQE